MNPLRRAWDRVNAASLARTERTLDREGWPACTVEGCENRAMWVVAGEDGHVYCPAHRDVTGRPMLDLGRP